jgi:CBS domain containing-hemolysin-like protein
VVRRIGCRRSGGRRQPGEAGGDFISDEEEGEPADRTAVQENDSAEIELISSVLEFTDAIVREVMVPGPT